MNIKLTSFVVLFLLVLVTPLFSAQGSASSNLPKLESYYAWLQGDWGQITKDGKAVDMRGCTLENITPDALRGELKTQYNLKIGYFYHGVISFGIMDDSLHVISNYTAPDFMFKKAVNYLRDSSHTKLALTPGVDSKGFVIFNFDQNLPGLPNYYTIVPLTNDSFKLVTKTSEQEYYFTRCKT
ncbi:MAG: hypothetical protein JKX72_02735 [Robiginitomaculum sp.]|nr:hypothetical protein [Robiginitomaculum sp.]